MLNSYKKRDGRDVSVLKYLTKVSLHVSKQKHHFNNLKTDIGYISAVVRHLNNIQEEIKSLRKLVWARNSIINPEKFADGCPHSIKSEEGIYYCTWCSQRFEEKEYGRWKRKYD